MSRRPRLGAALVALALFGWSQAWAQDSDCAAPVPVCAARGAVFPLGSRFDPLASAVRIGPNLLVTSRHVMADETRADLRLPDGRRLAAEIVPSGYPGDLVLLRAEGMSDGPVLARAAPDPGATLYAIGLDIARRRVRAYPPGRLILAPAPGHGLARLYHTAESQPGNSGGALVDGAGRLVGIVAAGGEGRNEAIPASALDVLRAGSGADAAEATRARGAATRACIEALEGAAQTAARLTEALAETLERRCPESGNRQLLDLAGQAFGRAARSNRAIALFELALAEDPQAINARIGLVVTLQRAQRHGAAVPHLDWLLDVVPSDLQVLRMATLSAKWGGAPELGRRALALIRAHHPAMAPAARKFLGAPLDPPQ
ncbi:MAG: trypsin-like peptidase domain-containing protein [Alphaproteobacteria bacterium]